MAINYLPQEESDAREVVALIRAAGRKAVAIPGDLRDAAFCKQLVVQAVQQLGGLEHPGQQCRAPDRAEIAAGHRRSGLDDTLKTNLYALFWITRAALPHLPSGAAIINTTSIVADDPPESLLDYATTKGGIVSFTKSLAKQLAPKGIPRQRGGARAVLDAAAAQRRAIHGQAQDLRRRRSHRPPRPAGGDRTESTCCWPRRNPASPPAACSAASAAVATWA